MFDIILTFTSCVIFVFFLIFLIATYPLLKEKIKLIKFSNQLLIFIYVYIISFITLILMVIGLILIIKPSFIYILDYPFSYKVTVVKQNNLYNNDYQNDIPKNITYRPKTIDIAGKSYHVNPHDAQKDFLSGFVLFIISGGIFLIHRLGLNYLFPNKKTSFLEKSFIYINLIITSLITLIFLPSSIYQVLEYIIFDSSFVIESNIIPGTHFAIALVVTPLWIYFLVRTFMLHKSSNFQNKST